MTRTLMLRLGVTLATCFVTGVAPLDGQDHAASTSATSSESRGALTPFVFPRGDVPRERPDRVAPVITVKTAPRSFHIVRVPVPPEFDGHRATLYTVYPTGMVPILSRLDGRVGISAGPRAVLLTVAVPGDARAGALSVGTVTFAAAGRPTVEVPVMIDVEAMRRVEISVTASLRGVKAGTRFPVTYQLVNLGNASDTVVLRPTLPAGWRMEAGDGIMVLPLGAVVSRTVHVSAPIDASAGQHTLRLNVVAGSVIVSGVDVHVEVVDGSGRANGGLTGSTLRVGAVGMRGPWEGTLSGMTYALDGHLTDGVQVRARVVAGPSPASAEGMMLARGGVVMMQPSLSLSGTGWRASVGPVGATLSDLTGTSVGGEGVSAQVTRAQWSGTVLASRPNSIGNGFGTNALYAQLSRAISTGRLSASVSSLRETLGPVGGPRQLDAVSVGAQFGTTIGRVLHSELAYRRHAHGDGVGASAALSLRGAQGALDVRGTYAAGGSQAFARGTHELSATGSRQLTTWLGVSGSAWRLDDDGAAFRSLRSTGWSAAVNTRLGSAISADVGARSFGYGSGTDGNRFGSTDGVFFGTFNARLRSIFAAVDASTGIRTRRVAADGIDAIEDRSAVSRLAMTLGASTRAGSISLSGSQTENGSSFGPLSRQVEYAAQVSDVPLVSLGAFRLTASGGASRLTSFVTPGAWLTTQRGSITAQLPLALAISFEAERNPLFGMTELGARNPDSWVYSTRVERGFGLRRLGQGARLTGVVFNDANGNGRRDDGEQPVEGIVMRRGGETVVTGRDGRYRFAGSQGSAVSLDPRSLPMGWIAQAPTRVAGDVPLTALRAVDVILQTDALDSSRVRHEDLTKAIVTARDTSGRTWVARLVAPGVARFDALPPGRYTLGADLSQAAEPLRLAEQAPEIEVGVQPVGTVRLQVQPRPLRFPAAQRRNDVVAPVVGSERPTQPREKQQ